MRLLILGRATRALSQSADDRSWIHKAGATCAETRQSSGVYFGEQPLLIDAETACHRPGGEKLGQFVERHAGSMSLKACPGCPRCYLHRCLRPCQQ